VYQPGTGVGVNEVVGRGALLGGCDGLLGVRQCLPKHAELGKAPGEDHSAVDILLRGHAQARQLILQGRHSPAEKVGALSIIPRPVMDLGQIEAR
jgi:hypothetical protein